MSKNHPGLKSTSVVALLHSNVSSKFEASILLCIRLFIPWQPFYCEYTNTSNFRWQQYHSLQWLFSLELDYLRFWSKSSAITGSVWYTLFYVLDVRWNSPILWKCFSVWSALWTRHTSKALNWQISKYQEELIAHVPKSREYHFLWPNLFLQHFYAQLATQGSSWLQLSTIWLYLTPGLIRSWLAIRITLANTKDITAIKGLHFIYLYFSVRSLHWELKHLASTCTKRSAEQLVSMHWYKNRFGFSSADTLR